MVYVVNESGYQWMTTPVAPPEATQTRRAGHFTLSEDGTLEGRVDIEMTGHRAMDGRGMFRNKSKEETLKLVREQLAERLPAAEPDDVVLTHLPDNTQPLGLSYKVRVPGFAEVAGARLVLPLNYFTAGTSNLLTGESRHFPIYLEIAETLHDEMDITMPDGFALDGATAPPRIGDAATPVNATYAVSYVRKEKRLHYQRDEVIGVDGAIHFRAESFEPLRRLFDLMHQADTHQIVLKRESPGPSGDTPPPPSAPAGSP